MRFSSPALRKTLFAVVGGLLLLLFSACASEAPQDVLKPQGPNARDADQLWDITFGIAVIIFFIVEGLLVFAVIKFRHRPDREAAQFHGNTRVEVILTVIPALILAGLAVPTVKTIFDLAEEPDNALQITVVGRQFWWKYIYEDEGFTTANEMHVPIKTPVRLRIEGEDVAHSFWIPRLAGAQDIIPGRINYMNFSADEPGVYLGQCKEFCGLSHANMKLTVIAHTRADYDAWVAGQQEPAAAATDSAAQSGEKLFIDTGCVGCHAVQGLEGSGTGEGLIGPDLTHFASRDTFAGALFESNDNNLTDWLANPPAMKPGVDMPDLGLSASEIQDLVAYLNTLE